MKVKNLMLQNFAKVSEITVSFSDSVTYLCGGNGSGKTTVGLNGIWFLFKGLAQKGDGVRAERFRFIGDFGKSATSTGEIHDERDGTVHKVTRKLLKNKTELKIESSDGVQRDQEWLDDLFSAILINPMHFCRLSGKEQALMLGIDTSDFEAKRKALEEERLYLGRDVKSLEAVAKASKGAEKVEAVSISELLAEGDRRRKQNQENERQRSVVEATRMDVGTIQGDISNLQVQITALENELKTAERNLLHYKETLGAQEAVVSQLKDEDESEIQAQISQAEGTNTAARAYGKALADQKAAKEKRAEYDAKKEEIALVDIDLANYLKAQKLPFSNITIEDGEFRLNGRPFNETYFSTGECVKYGARLGAKVSQGNGQKLDYVWIPDSQDLDEDNREALFADLVKQGFQVVAEFVSKEKQEGAVSILLSEQKVVEDKEAGPDLE